jgi:hypothetical protein
MAQVVECLPYKRKALSSKPRPTKKHKRRTTKEHTEPVAHAYNPSYAGGRDQEDHGSKPAQTANSF